MLKCAQSRSNEKNNSKVKLSAKLAVYYLRKLKVKILGVFWDETQKTQKILKHADEAL